MKFLFLFVLVFLSSTIYGQPAINVEVSADTILIGEMVEVKYTIENGDGKFRMPSLDSLPVISGPNTSSSFMYQNGEQHSSQSYSFKLIGVHEGKLIVPQATYISRDGEIVIESVEIVIASPLSNANALSKDSVPVTSKSTREKKVF